MRFIGKWLIWIGGGLLLWQDGKPLADLLLQALRDGGPMETLTWQEWLLLCARPIFVVGVIAAAGLPDVKPKKAERRKAPAGQPGAAAPTPSVQPASGPAQADAVPPQEGGGHA